jgi:hypothetical protein
MAKKRWDRSQYPENWEEISKNKREEAGWVCEFCGTAHGDQGTSKCGSNYTVRIAAAHKWPNDTRNPDPDLYALCQSCHFSYDAQFRDIIAEGKHQANMHGIALEQEGYVWCDHEDCKGYYLPHEH